MPNTAAATALALQYQLQHSQWWEPERLREHQLAQLTLLARHAWQRLPFWQQRLRRAGWDPSSSLDLATFRRIPLLTRSAVQQRRGDLRTEAVPDKHGKTFEMSTSGSTGRPVHVLKTELCSFFWRATTLRDHLWHRRDLSASLAMIRHVPDAEAAQPPDGVTTEGWGPSTDVAFRTGAGYILSIRADTRAQARWLRRRRPTYLLTYPSNLRELARYVRRSGKALPDQLREIRTVSEMLTPAVREECEGTFGVPIVDLYSTQEVGYLALQCPEHVRFHAQSEMVILEVLDDDGRPCGPGEVGRLVVTDLHNFATPLIRYELGDYAEVGARCPCGRGLPVLERVLGRVRNMLVYPDGSTTWPVFRDDRWHEIAPVRQYQFVQKTPERIDATMVADRPLTDDEEHALKAMITERLGHDFDLRITWVDAIDRDPSGKFEDFRSEVVPGG